MTTESIGVVGATGLVGREVLSILHERGIAADRVVPFASDRSAGKVVEYGSTRLPIRILDLEASANIRWFVFATGEEISRRWIPELVNHGATVVDNSSAFRLDAEVPLVIPEINGELLRGGSRLVANPNCSTIILVTALDPIKRAFGINDVHVATYQAVSGAGAAAVAELRQQTEDSLRRLPLAPRVFPVTCAFNVFCHESSLDETTGWCGEETKMILESQKIWGEPVRLAPFCVRVPVLRAHSQAIAVQLEREASREEIQEAISAAPGLSLVDDRLAKAFPTPVDASGKDDLLVGRIRPTFGTDRGRQRIRNWSLFVCGDQLRKGAALNALQIVDRLQWSEGSGIESAPIVSGRHEQSVSD